MQIDYFCPYWGSEAIPFEKFLSDVVEAGYNGVEMSLPMQEQERDTMVRSIRDHGLAFIGQHWETIDSDPDLHAKNYRARLMNLAAARPLFINTQTGKDYFSESTNMELIGVAADVSGKTGVPIIHETHRGKWSFAAHITRQYLEKFPEIRITLDISHWFNVAETFLEDQGEAVDCAIRHTDHVHARIGFTEGPQVSDPRAPEWKNALDFHLSCWDRIIEMKRQQRAGSFTITPEFGAPPYLPLLPYTGMPVASQWQINVFMMNLLKERYMG